VLELRPVAARQAISRGLERNRLVEESVSVAGKDIEWHIPYRPPRPRLDFVQHGLGLRLYRDLRMRQDHVTRLSASCTPAAVCFAVRRPPARQCGVALPVRAKGGAP